MAKELTKDMAQTLCELSGATATGADEAMVSPLHLSVNELRAEVHELRAAVRERDEQLRFAETEAIASKQAAFKCCTRAAWGDGEHTGECPHAAVLDQLRLADEMADAASSALPRCVWVGGEKVRCGKCKDCAATSTIDAYRKARGNNTTQGD